MKKIFTLITLIFFCNIVFGQNNYQDVVYLKNGGVIRGMVIEQVPNKSLKIETLDKNVFVYQMDEIEKITKEAQPQNNVRMARNLIGQSGYRGDVEFGYLTGVGNTNDGIDRLKFDFINGYQFNSYFAMGLGLGFRYYFIYEVSTIPVFIDLRARFLDRDVSPYFSLGLGYAFDASSDFEGLGLHFNPAAGVSFRINDKSSFDVGLCYEIQSLNLDYYYYNYYGGYYSSVNTALSSLGVCVGITF